MNTHYAVIAFSGDPAAEHPDEELRGSHPTLQIVGCGPQEWCVETLAEWTAKHPLRMWESGEILAREIVNPPAPLAGKAGSDDA